MILPGTGPGHHLHGCAEFMNLAKLCRGILNVHGSLLPKLRGAAPVSRAIINNESETGISIMNIAPHRFDVGPILLRRKCQIHPHVRSPELLKILAKLGAQGLQEVLLSLQESLSRQDTQSNEEATYAPKLTPELAEVNWDSMSALQVYNLFRGLTGFSPLSTHYRGVKLQLDEFGVIMPGEPAPFVNQSIKEPLGETTDFAQYYSYSVIEHMPTASTIWSQSYVPGQALVHNDLLLIYCADSNWVFCRKVKMKTKWMSAPDFRNGYLSKSKGPHLFNQDSSATDNRNKDTVTLKSSEIK